MAGFGGPYATKADVVAFVNSSLDVSDQICESDIADYEMLLAQEIINNRTDTYWEITSSPTTLYLDGKGFTEIVCTLVPITSLTSISIIAIDGTETALVLTGINKNCVYDPDTGIIRRTYTNNEEFQMDSDDRGAIFPEGIGNVKIVGTFGGVRSSTNILKMLQIMLVIQLLGKKMPSIVTSDIFMEKIGEYEYRMSDKLYSVENKDNKRLTLEGYINYLFDCLPKDGKQTEIAI